MPPRRSSGVRKRLEAAVREAGPPPSPAEPQSGGFSLIGSSGLSGSTIHDLAMTEKLKIGRLLRTLLNLHSEYSTFKASVARDRSDLIQRVQRAEERAERAEAQLEANIAESTHADSELRRALQASKARQSELEAQMLRAESRAASAAATANSALIACETQRSVREQAQSQAVQTEATILREKSVPSSPQRSFLASRGEAQDSPVSTFQDVSRQMDSFMRTFGPETVLESDIVRLSPAIAAAAPAAGHSESLELSDSPRRVAGAVSTPASPSNRGFSVAKQRRLVDDDTSFDLSRELDALGDPSSVGSLLDLISQLENAD